MQRNGVENRIHIPGDMWHHVRICYTGRGCCCDVCRELSAPSVVSAEDQAGAVWYGTLRVGIGSIALDAEGDPTNKAETKFHDNSSRFGIMGTSEVSEGLTAVYKFEHGFSTANAGLADEGRLAYAGLSGGFGNITAGKIDSASSNSFGSIVDNSFAFGASETSGKIGNVISYANTFGPASVQLDLMIDGAKDTGKDIDQVDFGLTVELGDIGKIAIAHIKKEDSVAGTADSYTVNALQHTLTDKSIIYSPKVWAETIKTTKLTVGTAKTLKVVPVMVKIPKIVTLARDADSGNLKQSYVFTITATTTTSTFNGQKPDRFKNDNGVYHPSLITATGCDHLDAKAANACETKTVYVTAEQLKNKEGGPEFFYFLPDDVNLKDGSTSNHIAAEFSFGGVTPYIGYAQKKMERAHGKSVKDKTTFVGVRGSVGDTGFGYVFQYRDKENADGTKPEPWILGLSKTMGGGASLHFEHSDPGMKNKKSTTGIWLKVDF